MFIQPSTILFCFWLSLDALFGVCIASWLLAATFLRTFLNFSKLLVLLVES